MNWHHLLAAAVVAASPADDVRTALANLRTLPPASRYQARYASFYHLPAAEHEDCVAALNVALNAVSRNRIIAQVSPIAGAGLARIDLVRYSDAKDARTYDELVGLWDKVAAREPYFHLRTQFVRSADYAALGDKKSVKSAKSVDQETVLGGWTGLAAHAALSAETGTDGTHRKGIEHGAIVRADFLIAAITSTERLAGAGYYEWADIPPTLDELLEQQGVDVDLIAREAADAAANLFVSRITKRPRRIITRPTVHGRMYLTKDVVKDGPERSPIRNPVDVRNRELGNQRLEFDAQELFYTRPNRSFGVALYDAEGKRVDVAPFVDETAGGHEGLQPMISCYRCHELNGGEAALQPFVDRQHALAINPNYFPDVAQRIRELYYDQGRVQLELNRDREDFTIAVQAATGKEPKQAIGGLARVYARYAYDDVTQERAARECGVSLERFRAAAARSKDPVLFAFGSPPSALGSPLSVTRGDWEDSFAEAMLQVGAVPAIAVQGPRAK